MTHDIRVAASQPYDTTPGPVPPPGGSGLSSTPSLAFSSRELSLPPEAITGLTMGHLLGKGAYGEAMLDVVQPVATLVLA
jgi:hypothetical protein